VVEVQSLQEAGVESQCQVVEHLEGEARIHHQQGEEVETDRVEEVESCS
jgi:hypothetical protein